MRHTTSTILLLAAFCLLANHAIAEENGWKVPNLNPFSGKTAKPATSKSSWMPSWGSGKKAPSNQPSTLQKMTSGTKRAWNKTKDFLNPFDDAADAPREEHLTGYNTPFTRANKKPEKKSSWLPSWGSSEKEKTHEAGAGDVNDFLAGSRPSVE